MKIIRSLFITCLVIALISAGWRYLRPAETPSPPAMQGSTTPGAAESLFLSSFADLHAQKQALAQWQGKVMVVNFWASWCPPCLAEIPGFIRLQKQYGKQGLQFVGIAIDQESKVQVYASKMEMNYPVLLGEREGMALARRLGNAQGGLPYTVIIDRGGSIVATQLGTLSREKLAAIVKPLL